MADKQPPKTKKYFRPTKSGAGMTKAGVKRYRRDNPGSKLKTAVTGKVKKGSKAAKRRKSYCARSAGQMKKFPKAAACLLYTSPSPRDVEESRMPSSA